MVLSSAATKQDAARGGRPSGRPLYWMALSKRYPLRIEQIFAGSLTRFLPPAA